MKKFYTAESVTEGHPDKLCDLIADNVLDACLAVDPAARVACEALATRGHIVVAGEISTTVQPDVFNITRDVVRGVGYDPKAFQIDCWLHAQSPDIAGAVNVPLDDTDPDALGAGDQGIVVGYACKETPQFMPLPVVLAHRLTSLLTLARMTDTIHGIGPDGKAQVTVEYAVNEPEHEDAPLRVSTVVLSVQHAANKNPDELAQELTEQVPYHNCVFVGKDEQGQPKYAALRGTYQYGRPFKAEAPGSDKRYGFCIPPTAESDTVAVFEAAIDAMAEMTLAGSAADKYRLSLGGIYVPEQSHTIKPPAALEEFLRRHPHVVRMELCLDNDPPGRTATAALAEHYGKQYALTIRLPQPDGADYGDLAQMAMRQKALKRERAEIAR